MKKINPEHIKKVIELVNQGPYFKLLSMSIKELDIGSSRVEIDLEEKHLNLFGGINGGVYSSLLDTSTYWALYCDIEENAGILTLDLKVDILAPVKSGKLISMGRRIKAGRNICLSEASVTDQDGKLLAIGSSKQMITANIPSMREAVKSMNLGPLAPKFG